MYFRDPKKELPKEYKTVFVRQKGNQYYFAYYSSTSGWFTDDNADEEEFLRDVIGWMPLSELDSVEIK